ncbi:hypothetical protein FACS18949_07830 [Clostridia bacterium]|nr:hypothetical protein FACS18949_07830 [Clostridia bacterium]
MMKKNSGFSLLELVVVVAIIAVMAAMIVPTLAQVYLSEAKHAASNIDNMISKCKVNSMSRAGDVYVEFYNKDNRIYADYYEQDTVIYTELIGKRTSFTWDNGTKSTELKLSFKRATGALSVFGEVDLTGRSEVNIDVGGYRITIVPLTGNHKVGAV